MWFLNFALEVFKDFLIWGFLAKRVLRWLTPRVAFLARLRAEHERYVAAQIASQPGEEREGGQRTAGCYPVLIRNLPLMRRVQLHFCLWLWGGALK